MARKKNLAELEASGQLKHNPARYADRDLEPTPPVPDELQPPTWLSHDTAKKHWPEFFETAKKMRVFTESDEFALAMLAESFAEWREAIMRVNGKPGPKLPRDLSALDKAHRRFLEMLRDFGMTPAARAKVKMHSKPPKENRFGSMAGSKRKGATKSAPEEDKDDDD
jgi:P27 family predicted phage terminase small subunit